LSISIQDEIISRYKSRTLNSKAHDDHAKLSLPGGDTRWAIYLMPHPTYMKAAQGCRLTDADDNSYIDFQNNYTVLIHGHKHPKIIQAVQKSLEEDILFGALSPAVYELSGMITKRMPGIDKLRFVNSGSEATMMAMRTARAFTKKDIIIKTDGGYHGSTDLSEINTAADTSGSDMPILSTSKPGVPDCILDTAKVAKFNDLDNVEKLLIENRGKVAGIIIEPVMNTAGIIPGTLEYLKGLRELADKYETLLIFDEIVTFLLLLQEYLCSSTPDSSIYGYLLIFFSSGQHQRHH